MTDHVHPLRPHDPNDTTEALNDDADVLYQAMQILRERWVHSGRYETTRTELRRAAAELISRGRHPSRQKQGQ